MKCLRTSAGNRVSRDGLFEFTGLVTAGPPPTDVPHNDDQDDDTDDTTKYTTNDSAGQICMHNGGIA